MEREGEGEKERATASGGRWRRGGAGLNERTVGKHAKRHIS